MVRKNVKRFLSILLTLIMISSCFVMNISAAEENVASIGDVFYNSVEDALNAAVSGDTVIVQKDTAITQSVEVKAGVTLLVPHKDGYTGYDPSNGNPDVNSSATEYVTDVLYRTLTVNEGVTITVNGNILVSALLGLKKSGHYRHEVNGNYAQMILNGKINVNNGGIVVANGYIKGSGAIEAFSGAEVRDLFVIEHFRGGTHSSYMRTQGVWIANEYDCRNITVEITIHYGAEFTVQSVMYFNSSFSYNVVPFIGASDGIFVLKEGGKLVRTVEYRDRIKKEAEVYKMYGGGYLGSISIKIYVSILPVTVNSSSFVLSMDGDNEIHLCSGDFNTYYNSKAISMKFLPGCELTIYDGAKFSVDRYKTTTRDRYSQIVAYRELTDSQFATNYRYPQGRPSAKFFVKDGGELYVDGEIGGEIYIDENAVVTKGDNAVFSVTTKESAKLSDKATETYVNDAEFIPPEGYHTRWSGNQLVIEEHTYSTVATPDKAPTCTESGTGKYICTCEGCDAHLSATLPATGHSYTAEVTAPTCVDKGYTTYTCSVCGDKYVADYVNAKGHSYGQWNVTDSTCTVDGSKTRACTVCGNTETEKISAKGHTEVVDEAVSPDCENAGLTEGSHCSVCGEIIVAQEEVSALGHSYQTEITSPTCEDKGFTTYNCSVCGDKYVADYVDALGHKIVTDKAVFPDCENTGLTEGSHCSACGEIIVAQEEVPALGHTESEAVKENEINPDCENDGSYDSVVYCAVCGEEISRTKVVVAADGHSYETETTAPDCESEGYTTYVCIECGDRYVSDYVSAFGHTEVIDDALAPTCKETGLTEGKHCTVCGKVTLAQETVPALGHTEETTTVDATCDENGLVKTVCTVCGETISEETLPALGHSVVEDSAVEPDCVNTGLTRGSHCSVCGEVIESQSVLPANGHSEGAIVIENEIYPDCVNKGYYESVVYCGYCGVELRRDKNETEPNGHSYEEEITAPDCVNDGFITYTCTVCGDKKTAHNGDAYGHTWTEWSAPQNGISERVCTSCGATEQQKVKEDFNISQLKLLRGTALTKTYKGEEYIAIVMDEGRTMTGIYKDMTSGSTVEITDICGNVQIRENDYVAYQSQNKTNPVATMKVTYVDGTTETFPVVFELYGMEREIDFDPATKIKPIRGKASLATDEKGDYILLEMADGQSSVGVYKASLDGTTATLEGAEGVFTEQEKLYIFYGSQNTFNPEGRLTVTEADGSTKTYRAVFKMYEMDPYVNAAKGLRPVRGAVLFDADGTIRIKMTKGQTSVGLYKTMANGATFRIVDENGKMTNNPSSVMFYMTNNKANITATMIFTLPDGTTKEQKIIFDMGLASDPDPLETLTGVRGTVSYQNDGTEDYIEVKANALSSGVGINKDCLVDYTITDADGIITENDTRYYVYKSQNPEGVNAKINFLQSDGTYKTYKIKFVF